MPRVLSLNIEFYDIKYFLSHKEIVIMSYVHFITIFVNDEVATFEQMDVICGGKVLLKALICVLI